MRRVVVAVPVELKHLVEAIAVLVAAVHKRVAGARGSAAVDYAAVEREIMGRTAAIECGAHEVLLSCHEVDSARVMIGGDTYARVRYGKGTYFTLAGAVEVMRAVYR